MEDCFCVSWMVFAAVVLTLAALQLIRYYFVFGTSCKSKEKMTGKTVIITGANTGIGKETAIDLAKRGARVIIACRDEKRALEALKEIKERSASDKVVYKKLDLASLSSIRQFASEVLEEEARLDVLVNNAGVMLTPYMKTEDGFELQFGVNHLGHFLLTMLLLGLIKDTPNSRIVVVSSLAHYFGSLDFNDMMWEKKYSSYYSYNRSKLANVMFANELASLLEGTGVSVYCLHPGTVKTELSRHVVKNPLMRVAIRILSLVFVKTPIQGAQTSIYCSVAKECEGISGKYWHDCVVKTPSKKTMNKEDCKKLFEYSAKLVGWEEN